MNLLTISDLHIVNTEDLLYATLIKWVANAKSQDVVVFAGDVFDVFWGSNIYFKKYYSDFFKALSVAEKRGVKFHYIEGNHDLLLQKSFAETNGVTVYENHAGLELGGKKIFIGHTVEKGELSYDLLQKFWRSFPLRALGSTLPGSLVHEFGSRCSKWSKASRPPLMSGSVLNSLRSVFREYAKKRMHQGYDFVILGHSHDLDEKEFQIGQRKCQYINVGYTREHGNYLSWTPGDSKIQRVSLP